MKLYLSSYRIPNKIAFEKLIGKPLNETSVALIINAKDYYIKRAQDLVVNDLVDYMQNLGLKVDIVDLRNYKNSDDLLKKLISHDVVWAMGGNTYMLRYEMRRSGFDEIIKKLLEKGVIYAGDSAGALVAGASIAGVEEADEPKFAEKLITDGLCLIQNVIFPHSDSPDFNILLPQFRELHKDKDIIELRDDQVFIYSENNYRIVDAEQ